MKTSPRRRKHRRRAFRRLFWLLVLATLLLLLWPRRVTLDGLNSPHAILLQADSGEVRPHFLQKKALSSRIRG